MIQSILDAATELVVDVGYEAVVASPTLLLERSGVSRGSFYSFFESPERVLDELAYRGVQQSIEAFGKALARLPGKHWTEVIDVLIDQYTSEHRAPLVRELWVRQNLTQRARELDHLAIADMAVMMLAAFRTYGRVFDTLAELQCRVGIHAVERLFQYAFIDEPDGDPLIISEARKMLIDYFAGYSRV